jgi:hypothetical protein
MMTTKKLGISDNLEKADSGRSCIVRTVENGDLLAPLCCSLWPRHIQRQRNSTGRLDPGKPALAESASFGDPLGPCRSGHANDLAGMAADYGRSVRCSVCRSGLLSACGFSVHPRRGLPPFEWLGPRSAKVQPPTELVAPFVVSLACRMKS